MEYDSVLSRRPSSDHIEGILKDIFGGQCKPIRGATLRQICGRIMGREHRKVGRGEWQLYHLYLYQLAKAAINCNYDSHIRF
jgi:hypothetical protein